MIQRPAIKKLRGPNAERLKKQGYRYVAAVEFPSGRTIRKQKPTRTKASAFSSTQPIRQVQTSPTAGGVAYNPLGSVQLWQNGLGNLFLNIY